MGSQRIGQDWVTKRAHTPLLEVFPRPRMSFLPCYLVSIYSTSREQLKHHLHCEIFLNEAQAPIQVCLLIISPFPLRVSATREQGLSLFCFSWSPGWLEQLLDHHRHLLKVCRRKEWASAPTALPLGSGLHKDKIGALFISASSSTWFEMEWAFK